MHPPGLAHCVKCDLKDNLWLCMTCGSLGCGRKQFFGAAGGGGGGGNGHGLQHFEETGHGISVKLGTITPEGAADIYCYICNDSKLDPDLASHLATFGINVQTLTKTEKTMTELVCRLLLLLPSLIIIAPNLCRTLNTTSITTFPSPARTEPPSNPCSAQVSPGSPI